MFFRQIGCGFSVFQRQYHSVSQDLTVFIMLILVSIKSVPDYHLKLALNTEQTDIVHQGVKMIINPFDAIALQEAVNQKKLLGGDAHITVVSIGQDNVQPLLRQALALGADQAIHIQSEENIESLNAAKLLAALIKQRHFDLVLMGKQAIDTDANQTPQMLGTLLQWPTICYASEIVIDASTKNIDAQCEWDEGLVQAQATLPAVISCDLRLNKPSPASLMAIMQAKNKPLETLCIASLSESDELKQHQVRLRLSMPQKRIPAKRIVSKEELARIIQTLREQL